MKGVFSHAIEVLLRNNLSPIHDQKAIGPGSLQHGRHRGLPARTVHKSGRGKISLSTRYYAGPGSARNTARTGESLHALKRPAIVRGQQPVMPIGLRLSHCITYLPGGRRPTESEVGGYVKKDVPVIFQLAEAIAPEGLEVFIKIFLDRNIPQQFRAEFSTQVEIERTGPLII